MVPLKIFKNGRVHELNTDDFNNGIIELCEKHRDESRALAFAFLIYDFCNPQIIKIIEDTDYWNALDTISGKFLSIYYIHSRDRNFAEVLADANDFEIRGMHPINAGIPFNKLMPMLRNYLALDNNVKLPSILFFQVEEQQISDYFLIELSEENIEKSFNEIKECIMAAVERLKMIAPGNYGNSQPIFESLKQGVKSTRFFSKVQKFPVKFLISLLAGEV